GEVEVGVIGQVDRREQIGGGGVTDDQRVVGGQGEADAKVHVAGKTFFAVGAEVGELHRRGRRFTWVDDSLPNDLVEAPFRSAMQRVLAVVGSQLIGFAVDLELRAADA